MISRKTFIKNSCSICVGIGTFGLLSSLEGCTAVKVLKCVEGDNKTLVVNKSEFEVNSKMLLIRSKTLDFDVLLYRSSEDNYTSLYLRCTHQDNAVVVNNSNINCALHGSSFNFSGDVLTGPAVNPLKKFKTEIDNKQIVIHLNS